MKIGIFDSGLGGLVIAKAIFKKLPQYDYVYLGDTKRVPYGNRSQETVLQFTRQAVEYLFKQNCLLVILACNSASALALRKLQREWLPKHFPDRRILGVIVPTVEIVSDLKLKKVGVIGTAGTVKSHIYRKELFKKAPSTKVLEQATPLLVPLVENGGLKYAPEILSDYLKPFRGKIDALLLGCTHYPILKKAITKLLGNRIKILSQDEIVPKKLADYLKRHPEITQKLSKQCRKKFLVTDLGQTFKQTVQKLFGKNLRLSKIYI
jgi:glutamate racemase